MKTKISLLIAGVMMISSSAFAGIFDDAEVSYARVDGRVKHVFLYVTDGNGEVRIFHGQGRNGHSDLASAYSDVMLACQRAGLSQAACKSGERELKTNLYEGVLTDSGCGTRSTWVNGVCTQR
jgi:hypothetical protein